MKSCETVARLSGFIADRADTWVGRKALCMLMGMIGEDVLLRLERELVDMDLYRQYMSEGETMSCVCHWNADDVFRILRDEDFPYEEFGWYNRWAMLATMELLWCADADVLNCAKNARAMLMGRIGYSVREQYGLC